MHLRSLLLSLPLLLLLCLSLPPEAEAQAKGKGGPPPWAPAHGYRAKTRHIYFPQHNFYFDVQKGVYIFLNGGKWQLGISLPTAYARLDLRRATQIELDLASDHPYKYNADHKLKYKARPGGPPAKASAPARGKAKGNGKGNGNGKGKKG